MPRSRRDDDDDDDRPRKRSRSRRDDDDEDEDEDDTPRKKRRYSIAGDDDDEDEDDRPRKRKVVKRRKKANGGGGALLLILGLVGVAVLLLGGGGVAAFFLFFNENPKSAFEDFQNSLVAKNYGHAYDRLDPDAQRSISGLMELVKMDPKMSAHRNKSGRELFIAVCEEADKNSAQTGKADGPVDRWKKKATVESVKEDGNSATLTVTTFEGKTETRYMKKIEGKWRLGIGPSPFR